MRFDREIQAPGVQFKEATRETPDYLMQTLAVVPLSVGVGLTVFAGGLMICWGLRIPGDGAKVAGGLTMTTCVLYGWWCVWKDRLYMAIETITGHDWNDDGYIGTPDPVDKTPWRIELEKLEDGNELWLNFDTPELRAKAVTAALLVENGTPFSENSMCGKGRPLSRSEFMTLRDMYLFHGLLMWKDDRHRTLGTKWTAAGRAFIRGTCKKSTTTPRMSTQGSQEILPAYTDGQGDSHD